jgi:outer membrane protein OmpA-like peptidoglycan-associated protein
MPRIHCAGISGALFLLLAAAAAAGPAQTPGELQKPREFQKPGEIQVPKGTWQTPGEIQIPKGIQAIRAEDEKCGKRFLVGADALFEFDKAMLTSDAEETLKVLVPLLAEAGRHPATVDGHTDAKGSDSYNQTLSENRAKTVRDWLAAHGALPAATPVKGWGKRRPVAPNAKPDGSDDPQGRQKNRRVEVVLDLCAKPQ